MNRWNGPVIATVDMLISLMVAFVALAAPVRSDLQASDKPVCQMAVDLSWQGDLPVDVDLWVMGPDGRPVGYSAKDGRVFNLVRDDLGTINDSGLENKERACARDLPDGEYIVNAHLYHTPINPPIAVHVVVSLVDAAKAEMREIAKQGAVLEYRGQQITILRFSIEHGALVAGSENHLPINLREKK